jgi:hypothetical protein
MIPTGKSEGVNQKRTNNATVRPMITPLVSSNCSIYNLVWPWHCLSVFDLRPLIPPLVSSNCSIYNLVYRGIVCPSLIYALCRQCHGHTKLYIEQFDDTNGVIIGRKSKDRQCHGHTKLYIEKFDDTNGVIRGRNSKTDRQCHGHTKLYIEQFDDNNGVMWHCLSFFDLRPMITPLVSSNCSIYNLVWSWHCLMPRSH